MYNISNVVGRLDLVLIILHISVIEDKCVDKNVIVLLVTLNNNITLHWNTIKCRSERGKYCIFGNPICLRQVPFIIFKLTALYTFSVAAIGQTNISY